MILVGIGANLAGSGGTPAWMTCQEAADALHGLAGLRRVALSHWYETEPIPPSGQPPYINGVARLEGCVDPVALLRALQALEQVHGRLRGAANAARTLDLDIVAMGGVLRTSPDPVLPHPRMHQRAFVLRPLLDVAPDWVHPALGCTAQALLAALPPQQIRLVPPSHLRDGAAPPI